MAEPTSAATRSNSQLWALLGGLGVIAVLYFYVMPARTELLAVRTEALAAEKDLAALQDQISATVSQGTQLVSRADDLARLDLAVPRSQGFEELLVALTATAEQSGVVVTSIQPVAGTEESGTTVSLSVRGSYGGVRLFVGGLAGLLRPISIKTLSLSATANLAGGSLVNATLELTAAALGSTSPPALMPAEGGAAQGVQNE